MICKILLHTLLLFARSCLHKNLPNNCDTLIGVGICYAQTPLPLFAVDLLQYSVVQLAVNQIQNKLK